MKYKSAFLDGIKNYLDIKKDGIYIDCTFGTGYHSLKILKYLNKNGKLYSFDCDPISIKYGKKNINDYRIKLINDNFSNLEYYINYYNLYKKINGIIFDLGLSNIQLDNYNRGFSFLNNGPLDMRMNQNLGFSLKNWINNAKEKDIYNIIRKYGQDYNSKRISRNIFLYCKKNKLNTTYKLSKIIEYSIKSHKDYKSKARVFQAFRIFINNELYNLKNILYKSYKFLSKKGRLVIISFNSLEDKIVKKFIKKKSDINYNILSGIPLTFNQIKKFNPCKLINLGKFKPSKKEILDNSRIRSAILRVVEKI